MNTLNQALLALAALSVLLHAEPKPQPQPALEAEAAAEALPGIQSYDYDDERRVLSLTFVDGMTARLHGVAKPIYEAFNVAPNKRVFLLDLAARLPGHRMLVLEEAPGKAAKAGKAASAACTRNRFMSQRRP